MSADNWAQCPRCQKHRDESIAQREAALADSYGVIPVEEFDAAREDLAAFKATEEQETFREDYEIYGAEEGLVQVTYRGHCDKCGLTLAFNHAHALDVNGARS